MQSLKKLVIYYSFEGSTEFIAKIIAEKLGADVLKLEPEKEIKSRGFLKFFLGGRQAMMKEKPELKPLAKNPLDYDLIFIGTPVWAWTFSPPLRSFFNQVKLKNKKIVLFCSFGGGLGKTFVNMKKELVGNEIIAEKTFQEPVKNPEKGRKEVEEWIGDLRFTIDDL